MSKKPGASSSFRRKAALVSGGQSLRIDYAITNSMMHAVRSAELESIGGDAPVCYGLTIFTQRWREIRDFYVDVLKAKVLSERPDRYAEIDFGGVPLCIEATEAAGMVSHLRLYVSLQNLEPLVADLRERGVIVVKDGPYVKFRDPEGRMIKASETFAILS